MTRTAPSPFSHSADRPALGSAGLSARFESLERLVGLGTGRIDPVLIDDAAALLERAGDRLRLSGEHTVVTLAGGTGSGKSSLFNAISGLELSPVGVRRPMTSQAHACVWGLDGAGPLLDWLEVGNRYRYARASALDGAMEKGPGRHATTAEGAEGDRSLQGLVLLDLPDHDSIQALHRAEVDRFVTIADLLVWVVDPQKYADASLHRNYIVPFARHAGVTIIVLNQIDRLQSGEIGDCVADLRRLLEAEGLNNPRIITTSTVTNDGAAQLRDVLIDAVTARRARTERLLIDLDEIVDRFAVYTTAPEPPSAVDVHRAEALVEALTEAAGAAAVTEAMESAYELRATDYVGWPIGWLIARLRNDPLRRMRLTELRDELRNAFTGPVGAQQGDVDLALQGVTDGVTADLPEAWARSVRAVGRRRAAELPEELGISLKAALPTFNQIPRWWWLIKTWQYFLALVSALGAIWLVLLLTYGVLGAGGTSHGLIGDTGLIPYVLILIGCALGMGPLTSSACHNIIAAWSGHHAERMEEHMRSRIGDVAKDNVLDPVAAELRVYARYRAEVDTARHGV